MKYSKEFAKVMDVYNKERSKRIAPKQTILYSTTKSIGSVLPERDVLEVSSNYKAKYFYEASGQAIGSGWDSAIRDNCPLLGYFLVAPDKILH